MATLTFKAGASWFTPNVTTVKRNTITAIDIVDSYVITGNEIDSWDASEDNDGSIMCYVTGTTLTIAGNGSGTIKFNADQSYWLYSTDGKDYFKNCTSFTGLSLIDTSNCTTLNRTFRGLEKITSLDISHFDISNVTSLYQTFCYCKKLTSLPIENWDVSNVTTMAYTFYQTGASTLPIENWNVSNVTNLDHTFAHSTSLNNIDLTKWDVSNVTNMNATFCGMKALTSLDLSTWDTSKVTCFPQFVEGCSNLETIYGLENFDTSKSVCFAQMFRGCSKLKELDLSSFDTRNADSGSITSDNGSTSGCTWQMITNTHRLEKITLGKYFTFEGKGVDIVPAEDIGTLPAPSATYIEEADGNWYTEDFAAYAPADVPNLNEMTYYASKKIVNDVIDARVLNYKGLKYVLQSLNTVIDESLDNIDLSGLETKEDASAKLDEAKEYVDTQIAAIPTPDVSGQIDAHNINASAHSDIRSSIDTLAEDINNKLKDKADYSHSHDNVYYTEAEVDDKLLVFDDRIVATDDGELTNVLPDMFGGRTADEYALKTDLENVSGLPEGAKPNQYIVTDGDGNAKWEDKLVYPYETMFEFCPEQQLLYMDEMDGAFRYIIEQSETVECSEGALCSVVLDGESYECVAHFVDNMTWVVGNMGIIGMGEDTGEPFLIVGGQMVGLKNSGDHTLKASIKTIRYKQLPSEAMENGHFVKVHDSIYMTEEEVDRYGDMIGYEFGTYKFLAWGDKLFYRVGSGVDESSRTYAYFEEYSGRVINIYQNEDGNFYYADMKHEMINFALGDFGTQYFSLHVYRDKPVTISSNPVYVSGAPELTAFTVKTNSVSEKCPFEVLTNGDIKARSVIVASSTPGSTKRFKITVDDSGNVTATEVT